jgi:hypothetical protein
MSCVLAQLQTWIPAYAGMTADFVRPREFALSSE